MLRSFRFGEADRVLHLYTLERGRVGAVAKGVRRTKSRFGARLEPFSHVSSSSTWAAASSTPSRVPRSSRHTTASARIRTGCEPG